MAFEIIDSAGKPIKAWTLGVQVKKLQNSNFGMWRVKLKAGCVKEGGAA